MACLFGHKWDGCKCERCGTVRDKEHDWDLCQGVCKRCGATQQAQHDWEGCTCKRCGQVRNSGHDYVDGICKRCGMDQEAETLKFVLDNTYTEQQTIRALERLSAQSLARVVMKCSDLHIRKYAAARIEDDDVLEKLSTDIARVWDIVYERRYSGLLNCVIKRIHSREVLERLSESEYEHIRRGILCNENCDDALLLKIAGSDPKCSIRYDAAKRLPEDVQESICAKDAEVRKLFEYYAEQKAQGCNMFLDDTPD